MYTREVKILMRVVSKNTNELKTRAPGRFGLEVSRLGWPMDAEILGHASVMRTPIQTLWLVFVIAGWVQRDQQAAMVYLLEVNRVLKAWLCGGSFDQALADPG